MGDLHPARQSRRDDDVGHIRLAQRGKESMFADEAGYLVMLLFIAERAGHAAATGVEIDHLRAWNPPQEPEERGHTDQGTLMTMGLHQHALRTGPEHGLVTEAAIEQLLKGHTGG